MDAARKSALEQGRSLEAAGQLDAAAQSYLRAGAGDEAARVLIALRRYADAGKLLFGSLGVEPSQVGSLDPIKKKRAFKAAICFANAGELRLAVPLFLSLGERTRAIELLHKAGDHATAARLEAAAPGSTTLADYSPPGRAGGRTATLQGAQKLEAAGQLETALEAYTQLRQLGHAGRVARALKRTAVAARLFEEGGMPYETGVCYLELGDGKKSLEHFLRVPSEDNRYRDAALHAIDLATQLDLLDFRIEHFLAAFVRAGPQDEREMKGFHLLAKLYKKHDLIENARDAYEKLLARNPQYQTAAGELELIERETRAPEVYEAIVRESDAFRSASSDRVRPPAKRPDTPAAHVEEDFPDLPELPELPAGAEVVTAAAGVGPSPTVASTQSVAPAAPAPPPEPTPTPAPASALAGGVMVAGRYRIEKKIGQGGMAAVYRAVDIELDEIIAIKFFSAAVADEQTLVRFKSEVSLSRQLNHPNIIRLYDIGNHGDYKYITMELLQGSDLNQILDGKPIEFDKGLDYLIQACTALQVVHERGIIHRDIKPDNFFVTNAGVLKVMDFGIAKRQSAKGLTVAGMIAGTPEYMSPEQVNDFASVTYLTDLYALGCIAYQMFTGELPFTHAEIMPLLVMHVTQEPTPPRQKNPRIPLELEATILKLLAKDPGRRVQSCKELAERLGEIRRRLPCNR